MTVDGVVSESTDENMAKFILSIWDAYPGGVSQVKKASAFLLAYCKERKLPFRVHGGQDLDYKLPKYTAAVEAIKAHEDWITHEGEGSVTLTTGQLVERFDMLHELYMNTGNVTYLRASVVIHLQASVGLHGKEIERQVSDAVKFHTVEGQPPFVTIKCAKGTLKSRQTEMRQKEMECCCEGGERRPDCGYHTMLEYYEMIPDNDSKKLKIGRATNKICDGFIRGNWGFNRLSQNQTWIENLVPEEKRVEGITGNSARNSMITSLAVGKELGDVQVSKLTGHKDPRTAKNYYHPKRYQQKDSAAVARERKRAREEPQIQLQAVPFRGNDKDGKKSGKKQEKGAEPQEKRVKVVMKMPKKPESVTENSGGIASPDDTTNNDSLPATTQTTVQTTGVRTQQNQTTLTPAQAFHYSLVPNSAQSSYQSQVQNPPQVLRQGTQPVGINSHHPSVMHQQEITQLANMGQYIQQQPTLPSYMTYGAQPMYGMQQLHPSVYSPMYIPQHMAPQFIPYNGMNTFQPIHTPIGHVQQPQQMHSNVQNSNSTMPPHTGDVVTQPQTLEELLARLPTTM